MARLKKLLGAALRGPGLNVVRHHNRHAIRILMYHRFVGMEAQFEAQCDHLKTYYRPISLTEAQRRLASGDALPANAVVVTIDDGYSDFYTSAFPILKARGIPATVYLVTGFLDRHLWMWTDRVRCALEITPKTVGEFPIGDQILRLPLGTMAERGISIGTLKQALKSVPNAVRLAAIAALPRVLGVPIPREPPSIWTPLTWDQTREMARHGIEFGGHTQSHPILSRIDVDTELESEIAGCRTRIEQELQTPVRHFCYPNGKPEDLNDGVVAATKKAGFETATSTTWGLNLHGADPYRLCRYGVNPDSAPDWFERVLAGFYRHG